MVAPLDPLQSSTDPPPGLLSGVRVLVVDDHEDTLELLDAVLTHAGSIVTTAPSARQALLAAETVDIVVTDYSMPGESGEWLLERIQARPRPVPVIVVTGFADVYAERLETAAFARILRKPVDPWVLCEEIHAVIHGR
jgi:CheY-like chemotaxis protein